MLSDMLCVFLKSSSIHPIDNPQENLFIDKKQLVLEYI